MGSSPTPPAQAEQVPDLPRLTVLRGLGAVVIVFGHVILMEPLRSPGLNNAFHDLLEPLALAGVSGFFTLSGFVLTWTARSGTPARLFYRRRIARLYPVHVVTLLFTVALFAAVGLRQAVWQAIPSLFLVNVWMPVPNLFWSPNIPSWTLSNEAFFYLLFPLLLPLVLRIPERRLYPLVWLIAVAIAAWAAAVALLVPASMPFQDGGETISRLQYIAIVVFPPARLLDFILGMLLARLVIAGRVPDGLRPWVYGTLITGYVASAWLVPHPFGYVGTLTPAVIIGVLYSARADLAGVTSRWATRTLLWFGRISFALYMVHWAVIYGGYRLLGEPSMSLPMALLAALGALAVSVALAQLLHKGVELPLNRRFRDARATRRVPVAEVTTAQATRGIELGEPPAPAPSPSAGRSEGEPSAAPAP